MRQSLFLVCLAVAMVVAGCVAPDQYQVLENRVTAIEADNARKASDQETSQQIQQLRKELEAAVTTARENRAETKYELEQVNARFQRIEGMIEEMRHSFGSSDQTRQEELALELKRLENVISQNYERIMTLEKYMGFEPTKAVGTNTEETVKPDVSADTEEGLYSLAKQMFDQGDKEGSRLQFETFINTYPQSKNADNARFWIAESYYAEKWFEKAILEYQKVLETYPDSNKTAAARLKQGYAFAELGEKANARLILKELIKRHPGSNEAKYAAEKLKSLN